MRKSQATVCELHSLLLCLLCVLCGKSQQRDPGGWGSDHIGKPVPEYVTGDECLFCHRTDIGAGWAKNRHQLTIREADTNSPALAALKKAPGMVSLAGEVTLLLGGDRTT